MSDRERLWREIYVSVLGATASESDAKIKAARAVVGFDEAFPAEPTVVMVGKNDLKRVLKAVSAYSNSPVGTALLRLRAALDADDNDRL